MVHGAEQKSGGGEKEVRHIKIRSMEAVAGEGPVAEARRAEQKNGYGGKGREEEKAQAASQAMSGEEE